MKKLLLFLLPSLLTAVPVQTFEILKIISRAPVFTQGLVYENGLLYESAGNYGKSLVRVLNADSGKVIKMVRSPDEVFAEGLALSGNVLFQITWREGRVLTYSKESLQPKEGFRYEGEGWGLTVWDGQFVMSDGSSSFIFRNLKDFNVHSKKKVILEGEPLRFLNELEASPVGILANVWHESFIVVVDPTTGVVKSVIDAKNLVGRIKAPHGEAVLNGIAYAPERDTYFVTGKDWELMFEVRLSKPIHR